MLGELSGETTSFAGLVSTQNNASLLEIKRYQKHRMGLHPLEINSRNQGKSLSLEAQQLAAFERDYWTGLHQLGLNYEDATKFAEKYYSEKQNTPRDLQGLLYTNLDDLKICCIAKPNYHTSKQKLLTFSDADYKGGEAGKIAPPLFKPILMLIKRHEECVLSTGLESIEYIGNSDHFDFFLSLFSSNRWQQLFKMKLACGQHTVHFRATKLKENNKEDNYTDEFINEILSVVLISGRPVSNYNATFYLPLDLSDIEIRESSTLDRIKMLERHEVLTKLKNSPEDNPDEYTLFDPEKDDSTQAQIQAYFSPLLHDQLFNTKGQNNDDKSVKPISHYQLKKWKNLKVSIDENNTAKAIISDVSLYRHELGQGLLAIRLEQEQTSKYSWKGKTTTKTNQWWHDLVIDNSSKGPEQLAIDKRQASEEHQFGNWLNLTHAFRTLYQSFVSQDKEDKLKKIKYKNPENEQKNIDFSGSNYNVLIEEILQGLNKSINNLNINKIKREIRDDRMFVNCAYALAGPSPANPYANEQNYRIFTIAFNVDRQKEASVNGYAYSKNYISQHLDSKIYKRWEQNGSYFGFSDHSHIYMGYGKYMHETIAQLHVPHIYGRMTLLNLLYRGQLQYFERKLCDCDLSSGGIRKLHKNIEIFTNQYWFHEITEQQQGKEIFKLQSKGLELESSYQTLDTEIKASEQNQRSEFQDYIGRISMIISFLGIMYALLPTQEIIKQSFAPITHCIEKPNVKDCFCKKPAPIKPAKVAELQASQTKPEKNKPLTIWLMQIILIPLGLHLLSRIRKKIIGRNSTTNSIECHTVFFIIFQLLIGLILLKNSPSWLVLATSIISAVYVYTAIKTILFNDNHYKVL